MKREWMNKTLLALSVQVIMGAAYAAEEPTLGDYETVESEEAVAESVMSESEELQPSADSTFATQQQQEEPPETANVQQPSEAPVEASSALKQQEGDATQEANL